MTTPEEKQRLRSQARARRAETNASLGKAAGTAVVALFEKNIRLPERSVIAGYWPMRNELDVVPLLTALQKKGHRIVLPVVEGPDSVLAFRLWKPGVAMQTGANGTMHPPAAAGTATPTVMLVPLLAYDAIGQRLGAGGGHYDRTIAALRAAGPLLVIGLAFSSQRVDALPIEPHDQKLDWVVTERGAQKFSQ
ncbi:MAG: 5-formyltetrahydrofolate cyclo-ligase [Alphaproteobacteria bacterium]|nr:5-formyltetrahydrofolate cyclo-ligase [Alphaproteobacteria bacterium]